MVTAERFSQISGSYWSSLLPQLSKFVAISNQGTREFTDPISLMSSPRRHPLVTETAFVAWMTCTLNGAEESARNRLAAVWNQVPLAQPLDPTEMNDVVSIASQLSALRDIEELGLTTIEPKLSGCGFISGGTPDFIGDLSVGSEHGTVLGEIKMVNRNFRSADYRQMVCYLALYYARTHRILEYLWLVNPIRGTVMHIDVDSFFMLTRGQASSQAVPELVYEWSSPGVSP